MINKNIFILVALLAPFFCIHTSHAGAKCEMGPSRIFIQSSDGYPVPGATYWIDISAQHFAFQICGDGLPIPTRCWRSETLYRKTLTTNQEGMSQLPRIRVAKRGSRWRNLSGGVWFVGFPVCGDGTFWSVDINNQSIKPQLEQPIECTQNHSAEIRGVIPFTLEQIQEAIALRKKDCDSDLQDNMF